MRQIGIEAMGGNPRGSHICQFYDQPDDLLEVLIPYLQKGLLSNERCIWVTSDPLGNRKAEKSLIDHRLGKFLENGAIKIIEDNDWYFRNGDFSVKDSLGLLMEEFEKALDEGYEGLRGTGNMGQVSSEYWEELMVYEKGIENTIHDYQMMALCSYPSDGRTQGEISDVVNSHDFALVRGINGWKSSGASEIKRIHGALKLNKFGSVMMNAPTKIEIKKRISKELSDLEEKLQNRENWASYPIVCEINRQIGNEIESWTKSRIGDLGKDAISTESFSKQLARIHKELSGAERVDIRTESRSMVMEVQGCNGFDSCEIRKKRSLTHGCLPDMVVAAILQKYMDTPVKMRIKSTDRVCRKEFTPAWMVDLLTDLDTAGVAGLVVLYKDRVLFSHMPSDEEAEALSESVLIREENPKSTDRVKTERITRSDRKILLMSLEDVFMSVCLRAGAPVEKAERRISELMKRTVSRL